MYFITVFEHLPDTYLNTGDMRCWGYYRIYDNAVDVVLNNRTDINEGIYNYCVIEEIGEGLASYPKTRWFYKFNKNDNKYEPIEDPEEVKHVCNFAIG
jgi:hypothetical protein